MRKSIFLSAMVIATLLVGCKTEDREGHYSPTRPGYVLFRQAQSVLTPEMNDLWPIFAFAEYFAAENDTERELIHDRYFYRLRITHTGDQWWIIGPDSELVIETGGKSLHENGVQWSYFYTDREYYTDVLPTVTRIHRDSSHYKLSMPDYPSRLFGTRGELSLAVKIIPNKQNRGIDIWFWGSATCRADDLQIDFQTTTRLQYNSYQKSILAGNVSLTTTNQGVTDAATANIFPTEVFIKYNGQEQEWNYYYEDNFRDE